MQRVGHQLAELWTWSWLLVGVVPGLTWLGADAFGRASDWCRLVALWLERG